MKATGAVSDRLEYVEKRTYSIDGEEPCSLAEFARDNGEDEISCEEVSSLLVGESVLCGFCRVTRVS